MKWNEYYLEQAGGYHDLSKRITYHKGNALGQVAKKYKLLKSVGRLLIRDDALLKEFDNFEDNVLNSSRDLLQNKMNMLQKADNSSTGTTLQALGNVAETFQKLIEDKAKNVQDKNIQNNNLDGGFLQHLFRTQQKLIQSKEDIPNFIRHNKDKIQEIASNLIDLI